MLLENFFNGSKGGYPFEAIPYRDLVGKYPEIMKVIEKYNTYDDIAKKLYEDRDKYITTLPPFTNEKTIDKTDFFARIVRNCEWETLDNIVLDMAKNLNCEIIYTGSDAGSTKIGNDTFTMLVDNGVGDGETLNIICDSEDFNYNLFNFKTVIEGKFSIYNYDCTGGIPVKKYEGKYFVYSDNGIVLFTKTKF